jgi:hypothetical protein
MDARQIYQKPCKQCGGTGTILDRDAIIAEIQSLQNQRDYAAPELHAPLTEQISVLLDLIEPTEDRL